MTKQLWAPWRLEYIQAADEQEGCVFCIAQAGDDEETLVVHRGQRAFVLLNKFPYASGHLMVAGTSGGSPARAWSTTSISISSRAGPATPISCRFSRT